MVETVHLQKDPQNREYVIICTDPRATENPESFFQGLTLYADSGDPVDIRYHEHPLSVRHNGPDETGRFSVTVNMQKLPDIW